MVKKKVLGKRFPTFIISSCPPIVLPKGRLSAKEVIEEMREECLRESGGKFKSFMQVPREVPLRVVTQYPKRTNVREKVRKSLKRK